MLASIFVPPKPTDGVAGFSGPLTNFDANRYNTTILGSKIIFVVGDKRVHGKVINGGEFFNSISPFKNVKFLERSYSNTSSQIFDTINKTKRKEQIVIWEK